MFPAFKKECQEGEIDRKKTATKHTSIPMLSECPVGYKCNSHFDHSWELTLQLPYFVGNIFSN